MSLTFNHTKINYVLDVSWGETERNERSLLNKYSEKEPIIILY